jgi:hypothetical protein
MKKELNPGIVAAILVCALAAVGFFLWHANVDKPSYPGANAQHPSALTPDQASKAGFSGATPGSKPPPDLGQGK